MRKINLKQTCLTEERVWRILPEKIGRQTVKLKESPVIIASAGVVGKKEGDGPLKNEFDLIFEDGRMGEDSGKSGRTL